MITPEQSRRLFRVVKAQPATEEPWVAEFARKLARLRQAQPVVADVVQCHVGELVDRMLADTA